MLSQTLSAAKGDTHDLQMSIKYCLVLCKNIDCGILDATGISSPLCGRGGGEGRYPVLFWDGILFPRLSIEVRNLL